MAQETSTVDPAFHTTPVLAFGSVLPRSPCLACGRTRVSLQLQYGFSIGIEAEPTPTTRTTGQRRDEEKRNNAARTHRHSKQPANSRHDAARAGGKHSTAQHSTGRRSPESCCNTRRQSASRAAAACHRPSRTRRTSAPSRARAAGGRGQARRHEFVRGSFFMF